MSIPFCSPAQTNAKTDSVIKSILGNEQLTGRSDQGTQLMLNGNMSAAGQFYSNEISKDESNAGTYLNRGVLNWVVQDTLSACRDWSAVLALGDTAAFLLLDKNCHGSMTIEEDHIPKSKYHKMFAADKKDNKSLSASANALNVADVMPEFPGGDIALFRYLSAQCKNVHSEIKGTVFVNFIISSKGKILFPYVARSKGNALEKEALRIIRNMPQWKPATQKGRPVLVRYSLPVKFS